MGTPARSDDEARRASSPDRGWSCSKRSSSRSRSAAARSWRSPMDSYWITFKIWSEKAAEPAAVDCEGASGDVAGTLRREERGQRSELLRLRQAPEGYRRFQPRLDLGRVDALTLGVRPVELRDALGRGISGENRVDGDPVRRDLPREGLGVARDRGPQAIREDEVVHRLPNGHGRDGQDPAPPPLLHARERRRS